MTVSARFWTWLGLALLAGGLLVLLLPHMPVTALGGGQPQGAPRSDWPAAAAALLGLILLLWQQRQRTRAKQ
ncbi:MAG: hypothetical protein EPN33_13120 [Acidobacteria bacterium]|nr:MAG: hypothetical protein EPN33_13120 [Acidobacteriota bacterium]